MSLTDKAGEKNIDRALSLNPMPAEYFYRKYELLAAAPGRREASLRCLKAAIARYPTNAPYHMQWGLVLLKQAAQEKAYTPARFSEIRRELRQAAALKPYRRLYQKVCATCAP